MDYAFQYFFEKHPTDKEKTKQYRKCFLLNTLLTISSCKHNLIFINLISTLQFDSSMVIAF